MTTGTLEFRIAVMISRVAVSSPPGVSMRISTRSRASRQFGRASSSPSSKTSMYGSRVMIGGLPRLTLEPGEVSECEAPVELAGRLFRKRLVVRRDHDASAPLHAAR